MYFICVILGVLSTVESIEKSLALPDQSLPLLEMPLLLPEKSLSLPEQRSMNK